VVRILDNVERLSTVGADAGATVVERDFLRRGRPVVLTDLFAGAPIAELADAASAVAGAGDAPLAVQRNYLEAILGTGDRSDPRPSTLGALLGDLGRDPGLDTVSIEHPTPAALLDRMPLPSRWSLGEDATDAISHCFVAGAGGYTHLHYDQDQRHVLLYQVFGSKRVVVVHPRETHKLDPMAEPGVQRCSGVLLHRMDDDDKVAFLRYVRAWDCVIEPGETLVIPAMAWHHVEYLDTALSVSWRLPRPAVRRALAEAVRNPSPFVQRVAAGQAEGDLDPDEEQGLATVRDAVEAERACRIVWARRYAAEQRYSLREEVRPRPVPAPGPDDASGPDAVLRLLPGVGVGRLVAGEVVVVVEGQLVASLAPDWVGAVLLHLGTTPAGVPVAELAAACGSTAPAVGDLGVALVQRGWATWAEDPNGAMADTKASDTTPRPDLAGAAAPGAPAGAVAAPKAQTLGERALADLLALAGALDVGPADVVRDAFAVMAATWADRPIAVAPPWSGLTLDMTPFEASVALAPSGAPELRFTVEAQAEPPSPDAYQVAADALTVALAERGAATDAYYAIADLYRPTTPDALLAAWHCCVLGAEPAWKIYVSPEVQGRDRAGAVVAETLDRLGHPGVGARLAAGGATDWSLVALDLAAGGAARLKLYERLVSIDAEGLAGRLALGWPGGMDVVMPFLEILSDGWTDRPEWLVLVYTVTDDDCSRIAFHVPLPPTTPRPALIARVGRAVARFGLDVDPWTRAVAAADLHPSYVSCQADGAGTRVTAYLALRAYEARYGLQHRPVWPSPVRG
jgi:hypothetical protein